MGGKFCDLEKAFECVNRGIPVYKLEFYGISQKFLTSIQSYLRESYQELFIDKINAYGNVSSRRKQVTNGVLQGSILGAFSYLY